ncbi:MAG TPA: glucosidase, partial [Verrucomicrobiae bacterium]|nr:glucosidase [Verrucomicrobiae bacterium]
KVECPVGSGKMLNLKEVAHELAARLTRLFLPDKSGRRPACGDDMRFQNDPNWKNLVLFHEYFNGDNGKGLGASHQTGWTALVIRHLEDIGRRRAREATEKKG